MATFTSGTAYHADSDADDEYERSVITSPTAPHTDSDNSPTDSEPPSNEHTPTTFGYAGEDQGLPRTIITEWTVDECGQFVAGLGLRQYCETFIENEIVGEALVALKHDELKEMGIASVGHRLTILKSVYETKVNQDIPIDSDSYIPLSAEQNPLHENATKDDVSRLAKAIIRLRDERLEQAESELRKLADDYRRLRQELLPVFKMAKERSEPLPYAPHHSSATSPELYQHEVASPTITQTFPEKSSLTRTFSKKLFSSTPKNNSPTHLPSIIHEGKTLNDTSSLDPSAAATAASNHLTASMSGGTLPNHAQAPSPTSPLPYQPLAPRSYALDRNMASSTGRYDGNDDTQSSRSNPIPTPPMSRDHDPPGSASSVKSTMSSKANPTNSTISNATTAIPSAHSSLQSGSAAIAPSSASIAPSTGDSAPSVEIFKSFRVGLEDPCYKVLPAALRKYNIQHDWRQYALYIVYGDQERAVGMDEKPLALFKDLDREGRKPMFMLRKLAGAAESATVGTQRPTGLGGTVTMSSAASARMGGLGQGMNLPGGVL